MAIIAISRSTLSGGKALAELVAEQTKYPIFSRETILSLASEKYGISEKDLEEAILKPPPFWQQVPGRRISYLNCITATLLDKAGDEDFIYHGHAGHLLLEGVSHIMRVRVIADMEYRIDAAMKQLQAGRDEAIVHIQKVDKERDRWMQFFYGIDWRDPTLYDMIFNLDRMSLESACGSILYMNNQPEFAVTDESKKVLKDLALGSRVWAALAKDKLTSSAPVKVAAADGNVTISGNVGSSKVMDAIPAIASEIEGVKQVINKMGVGGDWYW